MANDVLAVMQQGSLALVDDADTLAIANSLGGGLTSGGFGNRISLRGTRFRFINNGSEVGVHKGDHLDVVLLAGNPHVSRIFFAGQYDQNVKTPPDCYSLDGVAPPLDVPNRQSDKCMTCPQNVKGSSTRGDSKAKACAYKKRIVVVSPDAIDGDIYSLDVNGMSLFGEDQPNQNRFNLKSYLETLGTHKMQAVKLVTRLSFDDQASVPKLFFQPIRMLTPEEWEMAKERMRDDSIKQMLADVVNEAETGAVQPEAVRTPQAVAAPQQPAAQPAPQAQPARPAAPQMPPLPRPRGRPAKAPAPAEAEAAPVAAQPTNGTAAVAPANSAPAPATGRPKGFTLDLGEFDA